MENRQLRNFLLLSGTDNSRQVFRMQHVPLAFNWYNGNHFHYPTVKNKETFAYKTYSIENWAEFRTKLEVLLVSFMVVVESTLSKGRAWSWVWRLQISNCARGIRRTKQGFYFTKKKNRFRIKQPGDSKMEKSSSFGFQT